MILRELSAVVYSYMHLYLVKKVSNGIVGYSFPSLIVNGVRVDHLIS